MDELLASVKELSVAELRDQLKSYGQAAPAITASTKTLFQKRLAKCIYAVKYGEKAPDSTYTTAPSNDYDKKTEEKKKWSENTRLQNDNSSGQSVCDSIATVFYAVSLDSADKNTEGENVFTEKAAALAVMKKHPGSRFKVFKTRDEAREFAQQPSLSSPAVVKPITGNLESSSGVVSEKSNFKGPKTAELSEFRKLIERGEKKQFLSLVWSNPRYLVSSGDTPVIIHEGLRYNALHVAAQHNKPELAKLLLDILLDPDFTKMLYVGTNDNKDTQMRRIDFLVDLYLNTSDNPDRGNAESALHFASKFGFPDVIEVLLGYQGLNRHLKNKYGETPEEIICSRCPNATPQLKNRIKELLQGLCYVPLMRSEDNTTVPVVGHPWSPDQSCDSKAMSPARKSPKDPNLTVRARAGPMSPSQARQFYSQWMSPTLNSPVGNKKVLTKIRREDGDKGMERIGRQLAHEMHIPWLEYWEFLDEFADLSRKEGLLKLEEHLRKQQTSIIFTECVDNLSPLNISDTSSVFSMSFRELNSSCADTKSRLLIQPGALSTGGQPSRTGQDEDKSVDESSSSVSPESSDDSACHVNKTDDESVVCDNNNEKKVCEKSCPKSKVWTYREASSPTEPDPEALAKNETSDSVVNSTPVSRNVKFGKKEVAAKSDPWSYRHEVQSTNTDKSSPERGGVFQSPSHAGSEGSTSFDESVLATFSGMKLSSSDEEFHTQNSSQAVDTDSFQTPEKQEVSFNTALTNLCDDMKLKLIFSPEQAYTQDGRVIGCPFGKVTISLGDSHLANEAFRLLSSAKNMSDSDDEGEADQPAPVLVGLDPRRAGSDPSFILANVWVLNESLRSSSIKNIFPQTRILLEDSGMRNQLLNIESPKLMTVDISCDEKYTIRQRTVPVQALFFQAKITSLDVFIHGLKHSKADLDVFRAVKKSKVDMNKFPMMYRWLQRVSALSQDNKQNWPTPARLRREVREQSYNEQSTPIRTGSLGSILTASPFSPQRSKSLTSSPLISSWTPKVALFQSSPQPPQSAAEPCSKFKRDLDISSSTVNEEGSPQ